MLFNVFQVDATVAGRMFNFVKSFQVLALKGVVRLFDLFAWI